MQKKRQLKTCIVVVVLMCLLTISMTFQTICVKTISDNYINSLIVNQIIDLIIDEETDANFQQINQLQNKIKKSDALYQLNRYAFDQSMRNTNKNKIKLDQKELQKFSTSCKKMIKDELNISIEEKQIMNILKQNQFWNKMIHRMKNKLSSFSKIFVFIYSIMQSIFFRIIILLWILLCFFRLYNLNKSGFSLAFSIVLLVKALIDYMMIGLIEISKSFYIKMLNIPISSISIDSYLIVAMVSLMIGMILFVWHIYKAVYNFVCLVILYKFIQFIICYQIDKKL